MRASVPEIESLLDGLLASTAVVISGWEQAADMALDQPELTFLTNDGTGSRPTAGQSVSLPEGSPPQSSKKRERGGLRPQGPQQQRQLRSKQRGPTSQR